MNFTKAHERIIAATLDRLPPSRLDDARDYIESRLRPLLEINDVDVSEACTEAIDRYRIRAGSWS